MQQRRVEAQKVPLCVFLFQIEALITLCFTDLNIQFAGSSPLFSTRLPIFVELHYKLASWSCLASLTVYFSLQTDCALSIYMEYVPEGSIQKLLKEKGPFNESMIRSYTEQILHGLVFLHEKNVIHRLQQYIVQNYWLIFHNKYLKMQ